MEADLGLPVLKGMRRVHVINFFTYQGAVLVKWKHYMSSDVWSKAVCVVPAADVPRVAAWRPTVLPNKLEHKDRMHTWVDKLETNLSHSADAFRQHKPSLDILRDTIDGKLPAYTDGADIETIIAVFIRIGHASGIGKCVPATLPHDAIVQLFPGADLPETGVDALIEIPGVYSIRCMSMAQYS